MMNQDFDLRNKIFKDPYRRILKRFLVPLSILDYMPCLNDKVKRRIYNTRDDSSQQAEVLLSSLEESSDTRILQQFIDALKSCQDHKWLYPLFDKNESRAKVVEVLDYSERIDEIEKLWHLLKPQLQNINVVHCVDELSQLFSKHERESLKQKCQIYGNTFTLWWLFDILIRKGKGWIEEFCDFVKTHQFSSSTTSEPLINVILNYFDLESADVVCGQHFEEISGKCFVSPSGDEMFSGYEDGMVEHATNLCAKSEKLYESANPLLQTRADFVESVHSNVTSREEPKIIGNSLSTSDNGTKQLSSKEQFDVFNENFQASSTIVEETEPKSNAFLFPQLRNYQKELAELALKGKNVIICCPPGAGKTLVAAHVIKNYLETRESNKRSALFFTPGGALAQQQQQRLESYLPKKFRVALCCGGDSETSRLELHVCSDVIVMTPQMLLNCLWNKTKESRIQSICHYGLLVFDECHHCSGRNPESHVMREYFHMKRSPFLNEPLPQVVGLTATMGIGRKGTEPSVAILQLCLNLDARGGIVTVRTPANVLELNRYIPQPKQETLSLPKRDNNLFHILLISLMDEIMKILNDFEAFQSILNWEPCPSYQDQEDNLPELRHWFGSLKTRIAHSYVEDARNMISCVECLEVCGEAKDLYLKCHPVNAVKELKTYKNVFPGIDSQKTYTDTEKTLCLLFNDAISKLSVLAEDDDCANPNLTKIKKLILEKFRREPDSAGMFMVQKKMYARMMKEWMHSDKNLQFLNAEIFLGVSGGTNLLNCGISRKQQLEIMTAFRNGKHKMIISTPQAAGEGIDVPDCNLIISYDFQKSEVTSVQIKGRARRKGGEIFDIASSKVALHDELNIQRTLLMHETIKSVQDMKDSNETEYETELDELQEKSRLADEVFALAKLCERHPIVDNNEYFLICFKCKIEVCSTLDVRHVDGGHHVVPTEKFKEKYKTVDHPQKNLYMGPEWVKLNKIACKECSYDWGILAIWQNCLALPIIKYKQFLFQDSDGNFLPSVKKWTKASRAFRIQEASLMQLLKDMRQDFEAETADL